MLINCPSFHYNHNNISGQSTVKGWKWQWQGIFSVLSIRKLLQWLTTLSPQSVTENARKLLQLVLGSVLVDQCQSLSAVVQYFAVYLRKCRQLLFEIASGLIFCTTACLPLSPSRCLCVFVFSSPLSPHRHDRWHTDKTARNDDDNDNDGDGDRSHQLPPFGPADQRLQFVNSLGGQTVSQLRIQHDQMAVVRVCECVSLIDSTKTF